ncbi:MAG: Trk system potassium transporter TrkA, partial [Gammaproteobacteria bacterium]|nr:Trk system potassium transporter TrkA [Gammaproteobacteria bacterium]
RQVGDITLPPGTTIGAIVRGDEVLMAHHDTVIHADDHVIMLLVDRKHITDVEQLFQVGVSLV